MEIANLKIYLFLFIFLCFEVHCSESNDETKNSTIPQKICAILGLIVVGVGAIVYLVDRNKSGMGNVLREYISPSQAEITFVNFTPESSDPRVENILANAADRSVSFDDEYSRDEEMSVDQGNESENRHLSEVFREKEGSKSKKSKSRKRLANNVKFAEADPLEEENSDI